MHLTIRIAEWTILGRRCAELVCYLEEALLCVCSHQFALLHDTLAIVDVLKDAMVLVFSRVAPGSKPVTSQLVAILAQLVFSFHFSADASLSEFAMFAGVTRIDPSKLLLPAAAVASLAVACTSFVLCVHLDFIHHYVTTYDRPLLRATKLSLLACVVMSADPDVLGHFRLLDW